MARFTNITFSITRSSVPTGSTCVINYSYAIECDASDEVKKGVATFNIQATLFGADLGQSGLGRVIDADDFLGTFDRHLLNCNVPMPVARSFPVPCDLLDEDVFTDEIYLQLELVTSQASINRGAIKTEDSIQSAVIAESF